MNIHITWLTYMRTGPKKKTHPGIIRLAPDLPFFCVKVGLATPDYVAPKST